MAVILSLREMSINSLANNFDLYEEDPRLLSLPSEVSSKLLNGVLKNPRFKPTDRTLPLTAREVDLVNVDGVHQDAKIRYIFEKCRKEVESLMLPLDFFRTYIIRDETAIASTAEIKNPLDALRWFFGTALFEKLVGEKRPESAFYKVDFGGSPFRKLKVLKLEGHMKIKRFDQPLFYDSEKDKYFKRALGSLVLLCPNIQRFHLIASGGNIYKMSHLAQNVRSLKELRIEADEPSSGEAIRCVRGLNGLITNNPDIETLYLKGCGGVYALNAGLSKLRSLTLINASLNISDECDRFFPKLEEFMFIGALNFSAILTSTKSSTVKTLVIDCVFWDGQKIPEIVPAYPAVKLFICSCWLTTILEDKYVPEGVLIIVIGRSNVDGESVKINEYHSSLDDEEYIKYKKMSEQYMPMILERAGSEPPIM